MKVEVPCRHRPRCARRHVRWVWRGRDWTAFVMLGWLVAAVALAVLAFWAGVGLGMAAEALDSAMGWSLVGCEQRNGTVVEGACGTWGDYAGLGAIVAVYLALATGFIVLGVWLLWPRRFDGEGGGSS